MLVDIIKFMEDRRLCGNAFRDASWNPWKAVLRSIYHLPMSEFDLALLAKLTNRKNAPLIRPREVGIVAARRSGKSIISALGLVHAVTCNNWKPYLGPGLQATAFCVSPDRRQSAIIFNAVKGLLRGSTLLSGMIVRETESLIELNNGTCIEIATASSKTIRGRSLCFAVLDEAAFLNIGSGEDGTDEAIHSAIMPSLATLPGAMLWTISSPYGKRGLLWRKYQESFGKDDPDTLIFQAPAPWLNPTLAQSVIDQERRKDPIGWRSEWNAEFCETVETYISADVLRTCVEKGVMQRNPESGQRYVAFMDAASGSGKDAMTLGIAMPSHKGAGAILCATITREPPFVPTAVAVEFAMWIKKYGLTKVFADHYASGWIDAAFRANGITVERSVKTKSEIYETLLPALNSGQILLTDYEPLLAQLSGLERKILPSGRTHIDHASGAGGRDDTANSAAGALVMAMSKSDNSWMIHIGPTMGAGVGGGANLGNGFQVEDSGFGESNFGVELTTGPGMPGWPSSFDMPR